MTVVTATLKQLSGLAKPGRKFVAALLATMPALRGRVKYRNLARSGEYCERSYARQFVQPFGWPIMRKGGKTPSPRRMN